MEFIKIILDIVCAIITIAVFIHVMYVVFSTFWKDLLSLNFSTVKKNILEFMKKYMIIFLLAVSIFSILINGLDAICRFIRII